MSVTAEASPDTRREALANAVAREVGGGWHVESQTDYQAVLVRPGTKVNHILHLLLTLITLGVWAIVWIFLAITHKREHHKVVQVDGFGNVSVTNR
jgi:hypothetical protein